MFKIKPIDDGINNKIFKCIPKGLPQKYFCMTVQGSPASGKTTLALWLMIWMAKFEQAYIIISPTMKNDEKVTEILNKLRKKGKVVYVFDSMKAKTMDEVSDLLGDGGELQGMRTMLLIDDVTGSTGALQSEQVIRFCTNRRHMKLNIVLNVHTYKSVPKKFRLNTDTRIIFDSTSIDQKELKEETDIDLSDYLPHLKQFEFVMIRSLPQGKFHITKCIDDEF